MNSKLCKKLRREALFINNKPTFYTEKSVIKEVFSINKEGNKESKFVKKFIIILGECNRKVYKQLKKNYSQQYGVTTV